MKLDTELTREASARGQCQPTRGFWVPQAGSASSPNIGSPRRCMLVMFCMSMRCPLSPSGRPVMPWSSGCPHPLPPRWLPSSLWLCLSRLPVPSAPAVSGGTKVNSMMGW